MLRFSPDWVARFARRGRRALSLAALTALSGCKLMVLDPQGPVGGAENKILLDSTVIMLAIVVPTIIATLGIAWWFRASNKRARYRPEFAYSGSVELVTWAIPILVVIFLGGIAWTGSHQLDPSVPIPSKEKPLEIQAVSLDWKWLFIYPDQRIAAVNELVVPAGTPVHFALTSASVLNTFFVPQLGSMIYTMNGMATPLWLQADKPGTYYGRSAHFSGDGFPGMEFDMKAVPPDDFQKWVSSVKGAGPTLDAQSYAQLAQQSLDVKPFTYGEADPKLFDAVVTQKLPPGPGPQIGRGGTDVKPVHTYSP